MNDPFVWFWTAMVWGSIAWYGYLLFHVGWRGGRDILRMAASLEAKSRAARERDLAG